LQQWLSCLSQHSNCSLPCHVVNLLCYFVFHRNYFAGTGTDPRNRRFKTVTQ
jgi:hypothetical protein